MRGNLICCWALALVKRQQPPIQRNKIEINLIYITQPKKISKNVITIFCCIGT